MKPDFAILILGYKRPKLLENLLHTCSKFDLPIFISIDEAPLSDLTAKSYVQACKNVASQYSELIAELRVPDFHEGGFVGVVNAISWGFSKTDKLIIIEDDISPSIDFIRFAMNSLVKYESNKKIGSIGGTNLVPKSYIKNNEQPFRLSAYPTSWGWATWNDRWDDFLEDLKEFPNTIEFPSDYPNTAKKKYWKSIFKSTALNGHDIYDYRWIYSNWKRGRLAIIPNKNLVLNLGFNMKEATFTKGENPWWLPSQTEIIDDPYIESDIDYRDVSADNWMDRYHFRNTYILQMNRKLSLSFPKLSKLYKKLKSNFL
jgi:hypothetical protein